MVLKKFYVQIGGGYERALSRFPNEQMLEKFVLKYKTDPTCAQLEKAINEEDAKAAFLAAHTLKGVAQNLGFERLAAAASVVTEQLRGNDGHAEKSSVSAVYAAHDEIIKAIEQG